MNRKILLGVVLAMVSVAMTPMLIGVGSAQQGTTTYTFEECEEGWTTVSNSDNPLAPSWERAAPGDESEFAWHVTDLPLGGAEEFLVSPTHEASGSEIVLDYKIAYSNFGDDLELVGVQWSSDGSTWETLEEHQGVSEGYPAFVAEQQTFTPPAGPFQVRFRFFVDIFGEGTAEASVDNVSLNSARPDDATCASPSASPSGSTDPSASPSGSPTAGPTGSPSASPSPSPSPTEPPDDDCTVRGTSDDDTLKGTSGDDIICGYGGDDTINGRGGNDLIRGGGGDDDIKGGPGSDRLKGGKGNDRLRGGKGSDNHVGGAGTDTCQDDQGSNKFRSCEKRK